VKIQQVLIDELKPWDKNPRRNDTAVDAVATSIQAFGFNVPILYDQHMMIVAGHVRWNAAKKSGLTAAQSERSKP
jgi:ParB-like chromosome segregation protein Spo0J